MTQLPLENLTPRQRVPRGLCVGLQWCELAVVGSAGSPPMLASCSQTYFSPDGARCCAEAG